LLLFGDVAGSYIVGYVHVGVDIAAVGVVGLRCFL